jgi:acetoacetyl-CoA synthetase
MATEVTEGTLLWEPSEARKQRAMITRYLEWLEHERGVTFREYDDLWRCSVDHLDDFWASIWDFFGVTVSEPYHQVLADHTMPGATWFPDAKLNYAQQVFRQATAEHPALLFQSETQKLTEIGWEELRAKVASVAAALLGMGVEQGDRVAAYLPNIPESVIAFLAAASLGAIWSSCSPDFGTGSVIDRFKQIEPKVLFAVDGYQYNGKSIDRRANVEEIRQALPTVERLVLIPYLRTATGEAFEEEQALHNLRKSPARRILLWHEIASDEAELAFEQVPFDHPLWVLYSSGTTGLPKPIVQGHGGIVLEHLKTVGLHCDLGPGDRFFWFTTTGWMMWNLLLGGLLTGATVLLYDGSPAYPDLNVLWQFAEDSGMTCFGTSAAYLTSCMKAGIEPGKQRDLSKLTCVGSTGSPLPPEGFQWVYEHVKPDLWLASVSGGTDVCTAFLGGCPLLPVFAGELQCRALGARVEAWDQTGHAVVGEVGELVITAPMPSMPLYFWNDPGNKRYLESYFDMFPEVWRHGDWIKITSRGGAVIYGRSDSTLNRFGVRIGTSEIYRAVEDLPEIADSLVVGVERPHAGYYLPLFVVLAEGVTLDQPLVDRIKESIRTKCSPRHVPDEIMAISAVPRTLNGKKLEVPVKKLLMGVPAERAANPDGMSNPESLEFFVELAGHIGS